MTRIRILALVSLLAQACPQAAPAVVGNATWKQVQIRDEGYFQAMAMAPSDPSRFFISAVRSGVFRTEHHAESWVWAGDGLPLSETALALAVDPTNSDVVLAGYGDGIGLWRTENAGLSWTSSAAGLPSGSVRSIRFDPHHPQVCFAALSGGSAPGLYRSEDGGLQWSALNLVDGGSPDVFDIAIHPATTGILLAATSAGTLRSTNEGETWNTTGEDGADASQRLSWCASQPSIVYATTPNDILTSDNGGESFASSNLYWLEYDSQHLRPIACNPSNPLEVWAGGHTSVESMGDWIDFPVLMRSTNGGMSWQWVLGRTFPSFVQRHQNHADVVYAGFSATFPSGGVGRDGFRRSNFGGAAHTWIKKMNGISNTTLATVTEGNPGEVYIAGLGARVLWKRGAGWQQLPDIKSEVDGLFAFEVNPRHPRTLSMVGISGASDAFGPFYARSTDDGNHWAENSGPFENGIDRVFITTKQGTGNVVYVWAEEYDWQDDSGRTIATKLYRSDDAGLDFDFIGDVDSVTAAVIHPNNDLLVISAGYGDIPVQITTDGGESWSPLSNGLPGGRAVSLLMNSTTQHLTVVFEDGSSYRLTSFEEAWSPLTAGISGVEVVDADWDPVEDRLYLATRSDGVHISGHGFANGDLPARDLTSIHFSRSLGLLYVTSENAGLWERRLPRTIPAEEIAAHGSKELGAYPNPFEKEVTIDFTREPSAKSVSLTIFDVAGRTIRTWTTSSALSKATWDGLDANGIRVPAGVYFVRVESGALETSSKVILLR